MDKLSVEHVSLRLAVGHGDHLGMIVDGEVVGGVSFHPRAYLQYTQDFLGANHHPLMPMGSSLRGLRALEPVPFVAAGKGMLPL